MDKRKSVDNIIYFMVIGVILVIGIIAFSVSFYRARMAAEYTLSQGWELTIGVDEPYHDVNLETFRLPRELKAGETIYLSKELPETIMQTKTMRMNVRQAAVQVTVGGKEIYSYGLDRLAEGKFVGTGYHFIDLPATNGPSGISITLTASEDGGLNTLPTIVLSNYDNAYTAFVCEHLFTVFVSVFLFVLGLVVSVVSLSYLPLDKDYFPLVMIGFTSLFVGLWQILSVGVLRIFGLDVSINNTLEYLAMYFISVPVVLYAMNLRKKQGFDIIRHQIASVVCFVFAVTAVILDVTGQVHAANLNIIFEAILILTIAFLLMEDHIKFRSLPESAKLYRVAMFVAATVTVIDIARFHISLWLLPQMHILQVSIMPVGLIIFVTLLMFSYLSDLSTKLLREAERNTLTKLAYGDRMTGLSNRAKSTLIFGELDNAKDPYAIINMDLNGLKTINDTYGHLQGDELIRTFADLIFDLFGDVGECIRMSGDEFIVVSRGDRDISRARELLNVLPEEEKKASEDHEFEIDASYGMAESTELVSPKAEEVYRLADSRMYDMKVLTKKGRS